jgi:hypothetical protein
MSLWFILGLRSQLFPLTEHRGSWINPRVTEHTQRFGLHTTVVCMGKQLLCGNAIGLGATQAYPDIQLTRAVRSRQR